MYVYGSLVGARNVTRNFRIGTTLIKGQVAVHLETGIGEISAPGDANTYSSAVGITTEAATYATSAAEVCECFCDPFQMFRGRASGGTSNDTAHTTATLLVGTGASSTVIASTAIADLDYIGGNMIGITGANKGYIRGITAQTDNQTNTVTVAFPESVVAGDTFLRTYAIGGDEIELTATFDQFNNLLASGEALYTDAIGEATVVDQWLDGFDIGGVTQTVILNTSDPVLEFGCIFNNHKFNRYNT